MHNNKDRYIVDKAYDANRRNPKARAFYSSKAWKKLRAIVYERDDGLCVRCSKKGEPIIGDVVHHIIEIMNGEEGWSLRLDENNCETLCHACHNAEHKGIDHNKNNGIYFDENGIPRKIESI